ncbi:MAG: hypothetical protein NVS2B3_14280 [Vulcanimicrobiaceae bacterium]
MDFQAGLMEHLAALEARDIERFAATLSRDPAARVVAPDGTQTVGYEAIREAHRGWFASEAAWTFEPTVVFSRSEGDLGFGLLDVRYAEGAVATRFMLGVVFVREVGTWRLLYDQNTPVAAAVATERAR